MGIMSNYIKDLRQAQVDKDIEASKAKIFDLIEHNEMLDDDEYPTDAALDVIQLWHWDDIKGWFKFIESIWSHGYGRWTECEGGLDQYTNRLLDDTTIRYHVSTGGWSGNEDIIRAMQNNKSMLWTLNWVQSRRGGHHIFELRVVE
jgi:hypothetical protein